MNAVAVTITAARQSIPPNESDKRTANHAPDAAVQRRSHRICRGLLGTFLLASTRNLRKRDSALRRPDSSDSVLILMIIFPRRNRAIAGRTERARHEAKSDAAVEYDRDRHCRASIPESPNIPSMRPRGWTRSLNV